MGFTERTTLDYDEDRILRRNLSVCLSGALSECFSSEHLIIPGPRPGVGIVVTFGCLNSAFSSSMTLYIQH